MTTYTHAELLEKGAHHSAPTGGAWSRAEQHRQSEQGVAEHALETAAKAGLLKRKLYARAQFALDDGRPADALRVIDDALARAGLSSGELTPAETEIFHTALVSGDQYWVHRIMQDVIRRREGAAFARTDTGAGTPAPLRQIRPEAGAGEENNLGRPDTRNKLKTGLPKAGGGIGALNPNDAYRPPQYGASGQTMLRNYIPSHDYVGTDVAPAGAPQYIKDHWRSLDARARAIWRK
jgi:hypothetical protein